MTFLYVRIKGNLFLYYNEIFDFWSESASEGTIFTRRDRDLRASQLKEGFWIKALPN